MGLLDNEITAGTECRQQRGIGQGGYLDPGRGVAIPEESLHAPQFMFHCRPMKTQILRLRKRRTSAEEDRVPASYLDYFGPGLRSPFLLATCVLHPQKIPCPFHALGQSQIRE